MARSRAGSGQVEANEVATVRVLNEDKVWRHRMQGEESEEGLKITQKQLLVLAVQVCAHSTPLQSHVSPRAHLTCSRRMQIARRKGAPSGMKQLRMEHLMFKKGGWFTSVSHVGTHWYEVKNTDKDDEDFNGDLIKSTEELTDAERSTHVLPNMMSYTGLMETIRSALDSGMLQQKHIGKGSSFGIPFPDGAEVDEVANRLYGAPPPAPPPDACLAARRPPAPLISLTCCGSAHRYSNIPGGRGEVEGARL